MDSNAIIEREKAFIDKISDKYNYDSNIRHLLYLIIPAFIIKYDLNKETLVKNTFENIRIISSKKKDDKVKAHYSSILKEKNNDYYSEKYMVIKNYEKISLIDLLENLVHEFNHAINSYTNEIKVLKKSIYLRTGLSYCIYDKNTLQFIKKDNSFILEEIINTKQTEEIINIIKGFDKNNKIIENTIYAINGETSKSYESNSYFLQSYICKEILNNRTFITTLEKLRLSGDVYDIDKWFDNITGIELSYKKLINELFEVYNLEIDYSKRKFFKKITLNKIRNKVSVIKNIIDTYNNNVNYK